MDKTAMLERFERSRLVVMEEIGRSGDLDKNSQPVEGVWTVKDLAGHLTSWEAASLPPLRAYASGGSFYPLDIPDHDAWNNTQAAQWQRKDAASIVQEMAAVRGELVDILLGIPEERWHVQITLPWGEQGTLFDLVDGLRWHDDEHLKAMRRAGREG